MTAKSKGVTTDATMDSLRRAQDPAAQLPPDAQPDSDGREPWERDDETAPATDVEVIEVVDAELVNPISVYDDRAAELARREARATTDVALRSHPATVALDRWLAANQQQGTEADMAQGDIIEQVLTAATLEEVLTPSTALHADVLLDESLTVFAVKYQRSDYQEGSPFYAVMDAWRHDHDERVVVTVGAQSIIAQLVRIAQLGGYPCRVRIVKATKKPTRNGYWPLRLVIDKSGPPHQL